jgi:hypothetical protein
MEPPERLSFTEKLAYGLGDTASNFYLPVLQHIPGLLLHRHLRPRPRCSRDHGAGASCLRRGHRSGRRARRGPHKHPLGKIQAVHPLGRPSLRHRGLCDVPESPAVAGRQAGLRLRDLRVHVAGLRGDQHPVFCAHGSHVALVAGADLALHLPVRLRLRRAVPDREAGGAAQERARQGK